MARAQAKIMLVIPSMIEMNAEDLRWWCEDIGVFCEGSSKLVMSKAIQKHLYPELMEAKSAPKAKAKKAVNLGSVGSINIVSFSCMVWFITVLEGDSKSKEDCEGGEGGVG